MLINFLFVCLISVSIAFPDADIVDGKFQTAKHARGVPQGHRFKNSESPQGAAGKFTPSQKSGFADNVAGSASNFVNTYAENNQGGGGPGPTKTFYVNVPQENYPIPPPIAAGPPRQHYRIVFIRSPSPPPPQQILPPRVEQKTLIYVLHPRQQAGEQSVVEVPNVQHDPQVYFVQYENEPPTPQDLQELVKNTLEGEAGGNFNFNAVGGKGIAGAPSPAQVYPPGGPQGSFSGGNNNLQYKRGASEPNFAQSQQQTFRAQSAEKVTAFENVPQEKVSNARSPSAATPPRNRKRPATLPARTHNANRRSDDNQSDTQSNRPRANVNKLTANEPTSGPATFGPDSFGPTNNPTPNFRSIFGDTFEQFGGKLKTRTPTAAEKTISDQVESKS